MPHKKSEIPKWVPWAAIGALLVLQLLYAVTLRLSLAQGDAGQFGDMFGGFNALVSGVAMLGVVAAIFMQRKELEYQREELEATREELSRSADAHEKSHAVLVNTLHAQAYGVAHGILQPPNVREARRKIFQNFANDDFAHPEVLSPDARDSAEVVCHTFDSVGLLVRHGLLPAKHVAYPYAHSLRQSWRILSPLIVAYRASREAPELWTAFEELASIAADFKKRQTSE